MVEHNLLVNCDGESEMIGMKSSANIVRFNTIRASRGQISFRAGKKNQVYGNYMLGEGKEGTEGIRMLDENQLVYNNYVDVARWYSQSEYDNYHAQGIKMWNHKDPWWVQVHGTFKNGVVFAALVFGGKLLEPAAVASATLTSRGNPNSAGSDSMKRDTWAEADEPGTTEKADVPAPADAPATR